MSEQEANRSWLLWRAVPGLAAGVAWAPVVVGYVSVGAALMLGRSVREVLQQASKVLDQIADNGARTAAIGDDLRRRLGKPGGRPQRRDAVPGTGVVPAEGRRRNGLHPDLDLSIETQWVVWQDAASAGDWVDSALGFRGASLSARWPS